MEQKDPEREWPLPELHCEKAMGDGGGSELSTLEFNPGPRGAGQVHSPELELLHL